MKYQKVRALIVGFVFSVSTMTACGAYGSMESSVYGAEEAAVYGSAESFDSEYADGTGNSYAWGEKEDWEGFHEGTNITLDFHGASIALPDYMTPDEEESTEDRKVYTLETLPSGKTQLVIEYGRASEWFPEEMASEDSESWNIEDLAAERQVEKILDESGDILMLDFFIYTTFLSCGSDYSLYEIYGESADGYLEDYTGMVWLDDTDQFDRLITVTLVQNPAGRYNYREDLIHILENIQINSDF